MTTTISFATRDCVVIGCDSLATTTVPMIDPYRLIDEFFDPENEMELKTDEDGDPKLEDFKDIAKHIENVPYNQLPSITKIFDLKPAKIGILFAGAAVIGEKSIKNIVDEFKADGDIQDYFKSTYTVSGTAERLNNFISNYYEKEYGERPMRPHLEVMVAGYSKKHNQPEVQKIKYGNEYKEGVSQSVKRGEYNVIFGGQYNVIQRVVNGLDVGNYFNFIKKIDRVTENYRSHLQNYLEDKGVDEDLPTAQDLEEQDQLDLYGSEWVSGITTDLPNFSEQAAIDFVDFLVDIMCRAQQFSNRLPTVGGDIHIAIITKSGGFRWISKEEYTYRGRGVPKHD